MRFTVKTPVEKFTGEVAGVAFADGVAEVDGDAHPDALRYFRSAGYSVEPVKARKPATPKAPEKKPEGDGQGDGDKTPDPNAAK